MRFMSHAEMDDPTIGAVDQRRSQNPADAAKQQLFLLIYRIIGDRISTFLCISSPIPLSVPPLPGQPSAGGPLPQEPQDFFLFKRSSSCLDGGQALGVRKAPRDNVHHHNNSINQVELSLYTEPIIPSNINIIYMLIQYSKPKTVTRNRYYFSFLNSKPRSLVLLSSQRNTTF